MGGFRPSVPMPSGSPYVRGWCVQETLAHQVRFGDGFSAVSTSSPMVTDGVRGARAASGLVARPRRQRGRGGPGRKVGLKVQGFASNERSSPYLRVVDDTAPKPVRDAGRTVRARRDLMGGAGVDGRTGEPAERVTTGWVRRSRRTPGAPVAETVAQWGRQQAGSLWSLRRP